MAISIRKRMAGSTEIQRSHNFQDLHILLKITCISKLFQKVFPSAQARPTDALHHLVIIHLTRKRTYTRTRTRALQASLGGARFVGSKVVILGTI